MTAPRHTPERLRELAAEAQAEANAIEAETDRWPVLWIVVGAMRGLASACRAAARIIEDAAR